MNKDKFREICEKYEVVGANLWYIKDGVVTTDKYGYFDKEKNIKAIDDGVYRIASISKIRASSFACSFLASSYSLFSERSP